MKMMSYSGGRGILMEWGAASKASACFMMLLDNEPLPPVEAVMLSTLGTVVRGRAVQQLQDRQCSNAFRSLWQFQGQSFCSQNLSHV